MALGRYAERRQGVKKERRLDIATAPQGRVAKLGAAEERTPRLVGMTDSMVIALIWINVRPGADPI